jgi:VanZ family protein
VSALGKSSGWRAVPALIYAIGLFYAGVIDIGPLPKIPHLATDKLLHAGAFAGLSALIALALVDLALSRRQLVAAVASTAVGALLELVQSALPYRSAELLDLVADAIGAVLGVLALRWARRLWEARALRISARET